MPNIIKDKHYWKEYNAKRKDYLAQKKREARARLKMSKTDPILKVVDQTNNPVVDITLLNKFPQVVDNQENNQVVDQKWSFELFLEQFGYTNPNNPIYFSLQEIKEMKEKLTKY